jgi:hypothetical protein
MQTFLSRLLIWRSTNTSFLLNPLNININAYSFFKLELVDPINESINKIHKHQFEKRVSILIYFQRIQKVHSIFMFNIFVFFKHFQRMICSSINIRSHIIFYLSLVRINYLLSEKPY